jgi:hypothetical protein
MLIEVDPKVFKNRFPSDPHPFVSEGFLNLNKQKADRIVRLVEDTKKVSIGLVGGVKEGILKSPFSAPFGGFHFKNELVSVSEIENYIKLLKEYVEVNGLGGFEITLPPDLYHPTFNAKMIHTCFQLGIKYDLPDITSWVKPLKFEGRFSNSKTRNLYQQALKNELSFAIADDLVEKQMIFEIICQNRAKFDRPIFMKFEDLEKTNQLWPIDFFSVKSIEGEMEAAAIVYRYSSDICNVIFLGDTDAGRSLRAMDFMLFNLWMYYKDLGFAYIDMGISTEDGVPNEGLLRFKESHEAISSLRYRFAWYQNA